MKKKRFLISSFFIFCALILSSCVVEDTYESIKIDENSKAFQYNKKGLELMNEGNVSEAVEYFNKSLDNLEGFDWDLLEHDEKILKSKNLFDSPLNNLSWAYNELEEYEKSLEYIELSLKILPNSDTEYTNKGNALLGLGRYEEALESYSKAIKKNRDCGYAYYGKGLVYFEQEKYKESLAEVDRYLKYRKFDLDGAIHKVYCHLNLGEQEKALNYADDIIGKNKDNYDAYRPKGIVLKWIGNAEKLRTFYEETADKFSHSIDAQIALGSFYYNNRQYNKSLEHFIKLIENYPDNIDLYVWVINNYSALKEYDKALEYSDKALNIDDESHVIYNAIGNMKIDKTEYMESVEYFDRAIQINPEYEDAYINKLYALYTGKRYSRCIDFGKESEAKFNLTYNIPWFTGESYLELDIPQKAIEEYRKAINLNPENDEILSNIAYSYLLLEDYENSKEYMEKSLKANSENSTALYIKESLIEREKPIEQQIKEFFSKYYLYDDKLQGLDEKLSAYMIKENISEKEISEAISKIKRPDDIFTFVIYGEEYDYFIENKDTDIEYKSYDSDKICYLRINNFSVNTDDKAIEILDDIEDTENKTLIIDIRGNHGGDTKSANNILDVLLPECVTSTLIYRDGYTHNYYSDASQILFEKIYIFVDEGSASASELLTLGLKTYLKNVTVVGKNTFGKGVGQHVYKDNKRKVMAFVVSHYWNVRQTNIMDTYITPDIYVKGNDLKDFFDAIEIVLSMY